MGSGVWSGEWGVEWVGSGEYGLMPLTNVVICFGTHRKLVSNFRSPYVTIPVIDYLVNKMLISDTNF